jgi:hypothetical protein
MPLPPGSRIDRSLHDNQRCSLQATSARCITLAIHARGRRGLRETPKGDRFLINPAFAAPTPVTVVSDWTLALKK